MTEMTEKEIMRYRALKRLAERKQSKIDSIWDKDIDVVMGKVTASSKHFPYIITHPTVQMDDPVECDRREKTCRILETEIGSLEKRMKDIEDYIDTIADPELRNIFEMRVYDGMKWIEIAEEIGDDKNRTTYARKFRKYLENAHNAPIAQNNIV